MERPRQGKGRRPPNDFGVRAQCERVNCTTLATIEIESSLGGCTGKSVPESFDECFARRQVREGDGGCHSAKTRGLRQPPWFLFFAVEGKARGVEHESLLKLHASLGKASSSLRQRQLRCRWFDANPHREEEGGAFQREGTRSSSVWRLSSESACRRINDGSSLSPCSLISASPPQEK